MTRPTQFGPALPDGWAGVGGDPSLPDGQIDEDCCADAEEQPDRALGLSVFIGVEGGDGSLVQWDSDTDGGGGSSLAYPGDTTLGNLLVCVISVRGGSPGAPTTPTDWALVENGGQFHANNLTMFWRLAPGGPVSVAFPSPTNEVRLVVMEFDGASEGIVGTPTSVIAGGSGTTFTIPSVTVAAAAVMVGAVDGGNFPLGLDFTEDAAFTNIDEGQVHGGLDPRSIVGYRVVAAGTYGYAPTGSSASTYGGVLAAFGGSGAWVGAGPNITDGDDTTCQEVVGPNVARLWLGAPFAIARIRLYMEIETAGARTYILKGANEADFSDAVTVATLNFTATGSFTGQEVADSWTATDSYEFWQLTGDDETRNLCSFELYEGVSVGITDHGGLTGLGDDDHPQYVTHTEGDATYLLRTEGGQDAIQAHGSAGSTETIDPTDGNVHTLTLTADCTITLNAPVGSGAAALEVYALQDGTGGRTITWPGSVVWPGGIAPSPTTTLNTVTRYILETLDGGTTWYGVMVGAGASFATPAIVLGTVAAAGAATTVIRSDATIVAFDATVPVTQAFGDAAATGSAAKAARRDHVHGMPAAPTGGASDHAHVVEETHLSDGSTVTWTLDQVYEPGSVIAWNTTTIARLTVTEVLPDKATVSAAGTTGDKIVFDYAATVA